MRTDDRLVFWGVALVFLSLLTGLLLAAAPSFVANPRGLLAGHVEAAMNGTLVVVIGLFIERVRFSDGERRICRFALLYGAFANWLFTSLAGILGTSQATPLAGAGYAAGAVAETVILVALLSVGLAMIVAIGLLLLGLKRGMAQG
jgi:hydroxylaminobenzene mutase